MAYFTHKAAATATPFAVVSSAADGALAINDASGGDHVGLVDADGNAIVFIVNKFLSVDLRVWCFDFDLDVIFQVLAGHTDDGDEVWEDVGAEVALTAAADENDPAAVLAVIATLVSDNVRGGTYRIAAQLAGATAAGSLHFEGVFKA